MDELALKIENVSKEYRLGMIGGATLRGEIQSKFARLRHKEDPNLKIGEKIHDKNEKFLALDNVSFDVKKGEALGIIGHNGAGKSTLLKLICRVTAPTKGTIYMNGRITSMLEVGTGFHPELTGRENVYLNGAILGMTRAEIDKKFDEIVEFSEVGQFIDTPVKRYSSGMKVKLAFSVASHLDSEIMIMDEVLAVGDVNFQNKCIEKMKSLVENSGKTVLYVSHNMSTIRNFCDRCIVLNRGKIEYSGDVESSIKKYVGIKDNIATENDLTLANRTRGLLNNEFKFTKLKLIGKDFPVYKPGEDIRFLLFYDCLKSRKNIRFRCNICTESRSDAVSSSFSDVFSLEAGKNSVKEVKMSLPGIAPGKYTIDVVCCEYGQNGRFIKLDDVLWAINFEETRSDNECRFFEWTSFAHIIQPNLVVSDVVQNLEEE